MFTSQLINKNISKKFLRCDLKNVKYPSKTKGK